MIFFSHNFALILSQFCPTYFGMHKYQEARGPTRMTRTSEKQLLIPSLTAKQKQNLLYPLGFKEIFLVVQSIKM